MKSHERRRSDCGAGRSGSSSRRRGLLAEQLVDLSGLGRRGRARVEDGNHGRGGVGRLRGHAWSGGRRRHWRRPSARGTSRGARRSRPRRWSARPSRDVGRNTRGARCDTGRRDRGRSRSGSRCSHSGTLGGVVRGRAVRPQREGEHFLFLLCSISSRRGGNMLRRRRRNGRRGEVRVCGAARVPRSHLLRVAQLRLGGRSGGGGGRGSSGRRQS